MERPLRRVAFVAPSPQARGGIAQFAANLARAVGREWETLFLSFRHIYPRWTRAERMQSASRSNGGAPDLSYSSVLVPWLPWTWVATLRRIDRFRPELLVMQWWHPAMGPCLGFLARRARRRGIPVAFVCHNARPHEAFPLWRVLTRRALRQTDTILALSESVAQDLSRLVPGVPIRVMNHPANLRVGRPAAPDSEDGHASWVERIGPVDGPVILFFGFVRQYKGLQDLIAAMPGVRARVPATLVVAGPFFEPFERFRRQAEELGVSEYVRLFPAYVPDEEVSQLFGVADVLALPYRSASQSGIVPLAALFGVPVVATDVGGIPGALAGRGVIVPPQDREALADGLVHALRQPPPPPAPSPTGWGEWAAEVAALAGPVPARTRSRHLVLLNAARVLAWALVAYFVIRVFTDGLRGLSGTHLTFKLMPLVVSSILLVLSRVTDVASWHALVRGSGARIPLRTSARIFTTAELVRFLPGGALHLAARYRFAAKVGVPPQAIVATTALELGLRIVGGVVLFLVSLPLWPTSPSSTNWAPVLALPAFVVLLHPKVMGWIVAKASRLLGRRWDPVEISFSSLALAGAIAAAGWALRGVAAYLVAASLTHLRAGLLLPVAGATALSWVAGVLTPFAPGGLGVREAAGASLLGRFMLLSSAIVIVLVIRVQSILIELGTMAAAVAWDVRAGARSRGDRRGHEAVGGEAPDVEAAATGTGGP